MSTPSNLGTVTLVGAGPGDPELLTLKALKAIQTATVLFVDDLVSKDIVAFAQPGARVVYVGKRVLLTLPGALQLRIDREPFRQLKERGVHF